MTTPPFRTVIGTNHGKPKSRVWLEGARLTAIGFVPGAKYHRTKFANALRLTLHADGPFKVSGKGAKPIIDTTGTTVTERFTGTHVVVQFSPGTITITAE